jgi:NADH-quinone oxidoreductase subunit M
MIYDRYHTRDIDELSGLARRMPKLGFFFILFTLSSIALPGLNGFASEFLTILGAFRAPGLGMTFGVLAALGIILGAVYMLHVAARVIFGPLKTPGHKDDHAGHEAEPAAGQDPGEELPADLSAREVSILVPIALAVVIIGIVPGKLLDTFGPPVDRLLAGHEAPLVQGCEQPRPAAAVALAGVKGEPHE